MLKTIVALISLMYAAPVMAATAADKSDAWSSSYRLEAKGEYEKAAAVIVPFLNGGADREYANLRYGWLNYLQGNYNDAIKAYQRALEQNPRSFDARLGMAMPLMAQKRWNEATRYLKQVLAQSPMNYTAHTRLMVCEEGLKQWKRLEKHAASVAAYYPSDATAIVYQARAFAWQGKKEHARVLYQRVLVRYPQHLEAIRYINQ